jgi:hypothetical protein
MKQQSNKPMGEFEKFRELTKNLVSVPKKEVADKKPDESIQKTRSHPETD